MIRSIVFDLDGTLLDRNSSLLQFIVDQYERLIKPTKNIDKDCYISRFVELDNRGYVWKDRVYQELIKEFELPLTWNELLNDYQIGFCSHAIAVSNAVEILEKLKQQGYKLGMISNGFGDFQFSNIQALGIQKYFDVILISEVEGIRKPDPVIFLRAAEIMSVLPEECVYVGDHPINDVVAARNVGMRAIWKEDIFYNEQFEADAIIRDLLDIENIVNQWNVDSGSKSRPQLVLDVAGVIVSNLSSSFWEEIICDSEVSFKTIRSLFKQEVREDLWTGRMSEQDFYLWLNRHCPEIEAQSARNLLMKHLKLLTTADCLNKWSKISDIHLLSNHRHEWLLELLEPIKPYLKSITISSQVGYCKPDPSIYEIVNSKIKNIKTIYVDDQEKNLEPARRLGWITVLADEEGKWTEHITTLLQDN